MIHLATGVTADYPWAEAFVDSVVARANVEVSLKFFSIDHDAPGMVRVPMPGNRCRCLQHGDFLDALNALSHRDTVIFTDADMIMQRPFTDTELYEFNMLGKDEVLLAINGAKGQTLFEEAGLLEPKCEMWVVDALFPGWQELPVWNCGVIVARVETYRRLHDMVRALLPVAESCFGHYAVIQWVICYCVGRWLQHRLLPQTVHVHGHFGLPPNASFDADGDVWVRETSHAPACVEPVRAVFRHAIHLQPVKGPAPVAE